MRSASWPEVQSRKAASALARTMAGFAGSATSRASAASAPGAPACAAASVCPKCGTWRRLVPYQRSAAAAAHAGVLSLWQAVQASGAPVLALRSGRGTRMLWSGRGWTIM